MKISIPQIQLLETLFLGTFLLGCHSAAVKNLSTFPQLQDSDQTRIEVKQFLPNAFVVFHHLGPRSVNSLIVSMKSGEIILVDSPVGVKATQSLLSWIEYRMGSRKVIQILTSHRWDRAGGARVMRENQIPVYGSRLTANLIGKGESGLPDGVPITDFAPAPPDHIFDLKSGKKMSFGDERVVVVFPGPGYAADNVVVHFPDSGLVFAGGLVTEPTGVNTLGAGASHAGSLGTGTARQWRAALASVQRLSYQWLVPAQGRRLSPLILDQTLESLKTQRAVWK